MSERVTVEVWQGEGYALSAPDDTVVEIRNYDDGSVTDYFFYQGQWAITRTGEIPKGQVSEAQKRDEEEMAGDAEMFS